MTMTTAIEEMRLECLRLATAATYGLESGVTIKLAREYLGFVSNSPVPNETLAGCNVNLFGTGLKTTTQANAADAEVEAVAQAIASDTGYEPFPDGSEWIDWTSEARAAITALDRVRAEAAAKRSLDLVLGAIA